MSIDFSLRLFISHVGMYSFPLPSILAQIVASQIMQQVRNFASSSKSTKSAKEEETIGLVLFRSTIVLCNVINVNKQLNLILTNSFPYEYIHCQIKSREAD